MVPFGSSRGRIGLFGSSYIALSLFLCFVAQNARAQAPAANAPLGPIGPVSAGSNDRQLPVAAARILGAEPGAYFSPQGRPDNHTLSSIEAFGLGVVGELHSFLDPSFGFSQAVDSGLAGARTNSVTQMGFNLAFDRPGKRSRLAGSYAGLHTFYNPSSAYNSTYHNLGAGGEYQWERWVLRLRDDLTDSPETSFGTIYNAAAAQVGNQPAAAAADTILTRPTRRINNAVSGEINYLLSRRSALTFAGVYRSLSFSNPQYINSHGPSGRVGYDYELNGKNSVGFMYEYSRTSFSIAIPDLQTDAAQIAFGRKLTGRMALQISAGPQFSRLAGFHRHDWTLSGAWTYQARRTLYSVAYAHAVAAGSGVFSGAETHNINAGIHYAISHEWSANLRGGYSLSRSLEALAGANNSFGNEFGNISLERLIGAHMRLKFDYSVQKQSAGAAACPAAGCGPLGLRQVGGMTLQWHPWAAGAR